jgi:hypothetical protein
LRGACCLAAAVCFMQGSACAERRHPAVCCLKGWPAGGLQATGLAGLKAAPPPLKSPRRKAARSSPHVFERVSMQGGRTTCALHSPIIYSVPFQTRFQTSKRCSRLAHGEGLASQPCLPVDQTSTTKT